MDIKQLEAFASVVKFKSFSLAAKSLYLTQPTISAHIVSLEQELNEKLLVRTTREVFPTKVGQVLYGYAIQILAMRENAVNAVKNFQNSIEGEVSVSASTIPMKFFIPKMIEDFCVKNPRVTFKIEKTDSINVIKNVESQKDDLGFSGTTLYSSKCSFVPFNEDKLIIIAPNSLYYKTKFSGGYSVQRLTKEPFITRSKGSGTRKEAEYLLKEAGVDISKVNIVCELSDNKDVIKAVSEGAGLAVISNLAVENSPYKSDIITFDFENINRTRKFYIVSRKDTPLSPAAANFLEFAKKYYVNYNKFPY